MTYAFSRDGAIPGSTRWSKLTAGRVPANAVTLVAVCAAVLTLPALIKVDVNGTPVPLAFYAVTSIAVIGLYLAFAIPIWLRFRHGDKFDVGSWNNGAKYKWMNPIAVAEIVIVSLYLMLPSTPAANPFRSEFEWKFVNYAPIVTLGALVLLTIWWATSAKNWFTGPKHTIDEAILEAFDDKLTAD
jgi:energy-converting hydrogenase Eha subunit A